MDFRYHFETAWRLFTSFLPSLLIMTIVLIGASLVSFGILAPVLTAGYMQSLLEMLRTGRKPEVRDLFSEMGLFLPLLGFGILAGIAVILGFAMLVLPGVVVLIAVTYFCMYMLVLMTDQKLALFDAIQQSSRMAMEKPISEHLTVVAVYLVLTSIGGSTGLGSLFTVPFASLFVVSVYESKRTRLLTGGTRRSR